MLLKNLFLIPLAISTCCTLPAKSDDISAAVAECLQSSLKVYSASITAAPSERGEGNSYTLTCAQGSAVIYRIDAEDTYLLTNYHVVFSNRADGANDGKTEREIYCYLYGSEGSPAVIREKDDIYGHPIFDFGEYGIPCEYAGGSVTADLALLKARTNDIKAINENIREVTFADGYSAGDTAIAIGNTEGEGISVTRGIVSVENEWVPLQIDNAPRFYRCLRVDTPIYHGNSGGGLFNAKGELIGITNAGSMQQQNINFAIPVELVRNMAGNLLDSYRSDATPGAYSVKLGAEVFGANARYEFDKKRHAGRIVEEVTVARIEDGSIAKALGLAEGDILTDLVVNRTAHKIERTFHLSDTLLTVRAGDCISVKYRRGGEKKTSEKYLVSASDLVPVD